MILKLTAYVLILTLTKVTTLMIYQIQILKMKFVKNVLLLLSAPLILVLVLPLVLNLSNSLLVDLELLLDTLLMMVLTVLFKTLSINVTITWEN